MNAPTTFPEPPGFLLREWLWRGYPQARITDITTWMGWSREQVIDVIHGLHPLTNRQVSRLAHFTGIREWDWARQEQAFREATTRATPPEE